MEAPPAPDIATFRHQFGHDNFDVTWGCRESLRDRGLTAAIAIRAICDDNARVVGSRPHHRATIYTVVTDLDGARIRVEILIVRGQGRPLLWGVVTT